jgi:colicin import membrane protein
MSTSKELQLNQKPFPFYLRRSTYVHLLLILFSISGGKIAFELAEKQKNENLELIQASVRVDMVAMPTHTLNELKNISSGVEEAKPEIVNEKVETEVKKENIEPEVKEASVDPKKVDDSPTFEEAQAKKRQDFLSKLKSLGNKKIDSKGNQNAEKGLSGEKTSALKNLVLSGNKLSKGTQIYGDGNGGDLTAFQAYATKLPDFVRVHWKLPSFLMNKNLKCRVRVWLNMNGEVTRTQVYQSSGEPEYDQRAVDAIRAASPFPPLKEEFSGRALNGDLLLGFPL